LYALAQPALFALDAERAHALGLRAIETAYRLGLNLLLARRLQPLPVRAFGLEFRNPVGLAAGLDKNGAHIDALASLGFGFIEVGTITPKPQAGNPKPRMFRLPDRRAVINRLGFNNGGIAALTANLERCRFAGILGINIGKNKDTPNERAADDYRFCLDHVYARASYITINISSPNTQGLRDLQQEAALQALLDQLATARESLAARHGRKPLLLKIAPDLTESDMDAIASAVLKTGVDGVIAGNTTIDRTVIAGHPLAAEPGGLSGAPLMARSTATLSGMATRLQGRVPLIGVGGILSGADACAKIDAGASLVQFYTGLIYRGPDLIHECVEALRAHR
jgi:dihydroorotate dehydrogenase